MILISVTPTGFLGQVFKEFPLSKDPIKAMKISGNWKKSLGEAIISTQKAIDLQVIENEKEIKDLTDKIETLQKKNNTLKEEQYVFPYKAVFKKGGKVTNPNEFYKRSNVEKVICSCGSGLEKYMLIDADNDFCFLACKECEEKAKSKYRLSILNDPQYFPNGKHLNEKD